MSKPLARIVYLDEFGRLIVGDKREAKGEGPLARKVAELLDEARAGLDPDGRYSEDPRWVGELELTLGEYLAGGLGDLSDDPELRALLDEAEGWHTEHDGEFVPEELMRRYVELTFARRISDFADAAPSLRTGDGTMADGGGDAD